MRQLHYKNEYKKLLSPEIVSYLAQIHEQKGQQNLFIEAQKDALSELLEMLDFLLVDFRVVFTEITTHSEVRWHHNPDCGRRLKVLFFS